MTKRENFRLDFGLIVALQLQKENGIYQRASINLAWLVSLKCMFMYRWLQLSPVEISSKGRQGHQLHLIRARPGSLNRFFSRSLPHQQ